jgi:hypothetical protein
MIRAWNELENSRWESAPVMRKQYLLAATFLAGSIPAAHAAPSWVGGTSTDWFTPGNWNPATVPTSTSAIIVPSGTLNTPVIGGTGVTVNLNGSTASLSLSELLTINSTDILNMGARPITLSGGTIGGAGTVSGTGAISGNGTLNANITGSHTYTASGTGININGITVTGTFAGSSGIYNLNGATINGATLSDTTGQFNILGDSTLQGIINFSQYNTFNVGDGNGTHTLNLNGATVNTVSGGAAPFIISNTSGGVGTLNNYNGASTIQGGGIINLKGGLITNTSGSGGTTAGLFTIADQLGSSGGNNFFGTISGNVALTTESMFVTGGNLTLNGGSGAGIQIGTSSSGPGISGGSNTLDMIGNFTVPSSFNVNPGTGGNVLLDGANIARSGGGTGSVNNSGLTTQGTFTVSNASTITNLNFSTGNGANLQINAPLTVTGGSLNATNVTVSGTGGLKLSGGTTTTGAGLTTISTWRRGPH